MTHISSVQERHVPQQNTYIPIWVLHIEHLFQIRSYKHGQGGGAATISYLHEFEDNEGYDIANTCITLPNITSSYEGEIIALHSAADEIADLRPRNENIAFCTDSLSCLQQFQALTHKPKPIPIVVANTITRIAQIDGHPVFSVDLNSWILKIEFYKLLHKTKFIHPLLIFLFVSYRTSYTDSIMFHTFNHQGPIE